MAAKKIAIILCTTLLISIKCSEVTDKLHAADLVVSKYCPESSFCPFRGTHILCLVNPLKYGPACYKPELNVTMTPELAVRILSLMNGMRSKIAMGKEVFGLKGSEHNGTYPRAYSMWRLEWDSELATYAQIWANQCRPTYDLCHASERFPYSAQTYFEFEFKFNYETLYSTSKHYDKYSYDKLGYIVNDIFKRCYDTKNRVVLSDVKTICSKARCTDPWNPAFNYFQIINSLNTHVGCGISMSMQRFHFDDVDQTNQRILLLVCNFSNRVRPRNPLYLMEKPTAPGYSKCGCPPKTFEMDNCLCTRSRNRCEGTACFPPILILPLVTVENADATINSSNSQNLPNPQN